VKEGRFVPPRSGARLTFRDLATEALAQKKILLRPLSYQTDLWRLTKLYPFIGNVPAAYLSAARIEETLAQLCASMSGPTVNRFRSTISSVYSFAIRTGKMTTNPVWGVKRRRENPSRLNATTRDAAVATKAPQKRGPDPMPFDTRTRYLVGKAVEAEISSTGGRSRKAIIAARYAAAAKWKLSYETVKEYHNDTVDWLKGRVS
jgi:hypothetical protein